jgi:hypothetical protein
LHLQARTAPRVTIQFDIRKGGKAVYGSRRRDVPSERRMSERNTSQDFAILVMLVTVFVPIALIHIIAVMTAG